MVVRGFCSNPEWINLHAPDAPPHCRFAGRSVLARPRLRAADRAGPDAAGRRRRRSRDPDRCRPPPAEEVYSDLELFGQVFDRIRAEYVEAPDERKLIHAALQGMLTSLDPHSGYMEPVDYADVQEDTTGEFGGLGIEVQMEDGIIKVVSPIDDTPAAKAGILAGDYIVELDGVQVQGLSLDQAVEKMRGQVGTKIKVTVVREGVNEPLTFELARDIIATRAARLTMQDDVAGHPPRPLLRAGLPGRAEGHRRCLQAARQGPARHHPRPAQQSGRSRRPGRVRLRCVPRSRARSS